MKDRFDSAPRLPSDPAWVRERPPAAPTTRTDAAPASAGTTGTDAAADAAAPAGRAQDAVALACDGRAAPFDVAAVCTTDQPARPSDLSPARRLGSPVASAGLARQLGSPVAPPPHGRMLPMDLRGIDEESLLGPDRQARIYALGGGAASGDGSPQFHPDREPLILVHGVNDDPAGLQAIVDRFRDNPRFQLYVLAYDDQSTRTSVNGTQFADELRGLQAQIGAGRDVTLVAHSMGGLVSREAINDLSGTGHGGIEDFGRVRMIAVDSPFHGYPGPADGPFMDIARPFLPDGIEDMRAESGMFVSTPQDRGLFDHPLPDNVDIELVFAEEANITFRPGEGPLADLPRAVVDHYQTRAPIRDNPIMVNYWRALTSSQTQFDGLHRELVQLRRSGELNEASVRAALDRHFPRFEGDHVAVLGSPGLLDHLDGELSAPR